MIKPVRDIYDNTFICGVIDAIYRKVRKEPASLSIFVEPGPGATLSANGRFLDDEMVNNIPNDGAIADVPGVVVLT